MPTAAPSISTPLRWSRDALFHLAGLLTTNIALALWITGVTVSLSLAITYFGLVIALGTLLACRWFARVERRRAAIVLGGSRDFNDMVKSHLPISVSRRPPARGSAHGCRCSSSSCSSACRWTTTCSSSAVREAVIGGMPTGDAVAHGIKSTTGVVTSAALVMIAVFSIFATLGAIEFKQMGVGLASAILVDATLVRAVPLPATMKLLGDWNWYLPRGLSWLQRAGGAVAAQRA